MRPWHTAHDSLVQLGFRRSTLATVDTEKSLQDCALDRAGFLSSTVPKGSRTQIIGV